MSAGWICTEDERAWRRKRLARLQSPMATAHSLATRSDHEGLRTQDSGLRTQDLGPRTSVERHECHCPRPVARDMERPRKESPIDCKS